MIGEALKAKAAPPYLLPVIGTLVLVAAGGAFWWLWNDRDRLLTEKAHQAQLLSQAANASRENLLAIDSLTAAIAWRDQKALERQNRLAKRETELAQVREELKEAMQDAPDCVNQPWPDSVFDIMRRDTVLDQNRVRSGAGASGVPATDSNARAGG